MNPYRVTLAVVLLGLFCTFWISDAFAQLHDWNGSRTSPGSIYRRGPNGLPFNVDTGRYVGIDSASDGGATLKGRYSGSLAGRSLAIQSAQIVSGSTLATLGKGLARAAGPVAIGLTLAPLIWDEIQEDWLTPRDGLLDGNQWPPQFYWLRVVSGSPPDDTQRQSSPSGHCVSNSSYTRFLQNPSYNAFGEPVQWECWQTSKSTGVTTNTGTRIVRFANCVDNGGVYSPSTNMCSTSVSCAPGTLRDPANGQCVPGFQPTTDQQLEDAIYVELVARGMGSDLARRLINAGYEPQIIGEAGPIELSGPSSVEGGTTSSTTTGPAGTTITNTTTNYDITYQGDTVTVTETTTTTTTRPDGSTETSTETKTPAPGTDAPSQPSETEQTPFCEQYPDASACQPLGSAGDQELNAETRTVQLDYTGAAGSCPAPHMMNLQGKSVSFSYGPLCDFAQGIRPLVIALSMLFAGLFLLSVGRSQ